jgi:hypothetical protein
MFSRVSEVLKSQSQVSGWKDLTVGPMTDTVYACNGAMEDWAYGAAWDLSPESRVNSCNPDTYLPFNITEYFTNYSHIKPAIYLIEASNRKLPLESKYGNSKDVF